MVQQKYTFRLTEKQMMEAAAASRAHASVLMSSEGDRSRSKYLHELAKTLEKQVARVKLIPGSEAARRVGCRCPHTRCSVHNLVSHETELQ